MADLGVEFSGFKLSNPTILASGILGVNKSSLSKAVCGGAAAVTTKSISVEPRAGHNNPIIVETDNGLLNAVGYSNMGLYAAIDEFSDNSTIGAPVIVSIVGENDDDFRELAKNVSQMDVSAVEIPLSCPHTPGFGLLAGHGTVEAAERITKIVRDECNLPIIFKLSPNVPALGEIAVAAVKAGADILNMGNTLGPAMKINVDAAKPVLDFKVGGYSGPAVKPVTIRCIYDVFEATKGKTPIIGCGGITTGSDAIEAFMAGASAVSVGTGVLYRGFSVFKKICDEIVEFMNDKKYFLIEEMVGLAHES